jgi:hypothetical protein
MQPSYLHFKRFTGSSDIPVYYYLKCTLLGVLQFNVDMRAALGNPAVCHRLLLVGSRTCRVALDTRITHLWYYFEQDR